MTLLIFWILSGILAGWLAGMLVRTSSVGMGGDFLFGLIGGLVGGYLGSLIGLPALVLQVQIFAAAVGGALAVWMIHLLAPSRMNL